LTGSQSDDIAAKVTLSSPNNISEGDPPSCGPHLRLAQDIPKAYNTIHPPPQYPATESSPSSSLQYFAFTQDPSSHQAGGTLFNRNNRLRDPTGDSVTPAAPAYASLGEDSASSHFPDQTYEETVSETKRVHSQDSKCVSPKKEDDTEPPPAYSEGSSPLSTFTYLMAAAGGAASIITQVQQSGGPTNTLGGIANSLLFDMNTGS
jgi:hypothetical protein